LALNIYYHLQNPDEVSDHIKKSIKIIALGGEFILKPVHNIQPSAPPESIVAMLKTTHDFEKYPIK